MDEEKGNLPKSSLAVAALGGLVLPWLLSIGIFTTRAETAEFKAEMAEKYISKVDVNARLEKIEKSIEKLIDKLGDRH